MTVIEQKNLKSCPSLPNANRSLQLMVVNLRLYHHRHLENLQRTVITARFALDCKCYLQNREGSLAIEITREKICYILIVSRRTDLLWIFMIE
jgi:hypothetical protein